MTSIGTGIFKDKDKDESETEDFDAGFTVPNTADLISRLELAEKQELVREHQQLMDEEDKEDVKKGKAKRERKPKQNNVICFCGSPPCRIGPFVNADGSEANG